MQELPPDTWASIAGYLPSQALPDLISVNRALFNLVLDTRYGVVEWGTLDKKLIKLLERLQSVRFSRVLWFYTHTIYVLEILQ